MWRRGEQAVRLFRRQDAAGAAAASACESEVRRLRRQRCLLSRNPGSRWRVQLRATPFLVPRCCCGSCPPSRVTTHKQASSTPPSTDRQFLRAARSKALLSRWRQHHRVPATKSFCISHRHWEPWALPLVVAGGIGADWAAGAAFRTASGRDPNQTSDKPISTFAAAYSSHGSSSSRTPLTGGAPAGRH